MPTSVRRSGARDSWGSRPVIAAAAFLVVMLAAVQPAPAQIIGQAPWCADMGGVVPGSLECQYFTYAQCYARASGISNICFRNPWYFPARPEASVLRRVPRKR